MNALVVPVDIDVMMRLVGACLSGFNGEPAANIFAFNIIEIAGQEQVRVDCSARRNFELRRGEVEPLEPAAQFAETKESRRARVWSRGRVGRR